MRVGTSRHLLLQLIANSGPASGLRSAVEPALKPILFEPQLNLRHRTETDDFEVAAAAVAGRQQLGLDCLRTFHFLRSRPDKAGVL